MPFGSEILSQLSCCIGRSEQEHPSKRDNHTHPRIQNKLKVCSRCQSLPFSILCIITMATAVLQPQQQRLATPFKYIGNQSSLSKPTPSPLILQPFPLEHNQPIPLGNLQARRKKLKSIAPPCPLRHCQIRCSLTFMSSRCHPLPSTTRASPQQGSSARDLLDARIPAEGHYAYGTPTNTTRFERKREKKQKREAKATVEKIKTKDNRLSATPTLKWLGACGR